MKQVTVFMLVLFLITISSCQFDQSKNVYVPTQEIRVFEATLSDGVEELNNEDNFTFDDLAAPNASISIIDIDVQPEEYEIGSVIYVESNDSLDGYAVKKITGVTLTAEGVVLTTENALISEAFEELNIHVKTQLGGNENFDVRTVKGVEFTGIFTTSEVRRSFDIIHDDNYTIDGVQNFFGFKITDFIIYDDDGNDSTKDDQITIDGLLYLSLNGELELVAGSGGVEYFNYSMTGQQYLELSKSFDINLIDINNELSLGSLVFPIPSTPIMMDIEFFLGLDATANANLYAGFQEQATIEVGIEYDGSEWSGNYENSYDFQLTPFEFYGTSTFRPYIGVGFGASLLNTVRFGIDTEIYTQITASCDGGISIDDFSDSFLDNFWFDGYANIILGVKVDAVTELALLGWAIAEYNYPIADLYTTMLNVPRISEPLDSFLPDFVLNPPIATDAIYGVGYANQSTVSLPIITAETNAKIDIANQIETTIQEAITAYAQEVGVANNTQLISFIETLTQQITDTTLTGIATMSRVPMDDGGVWVLMVYEKETLTSSFISTAEEFETTGDTPFTDFNATLALDKLNYELENNPTQSDPVE